MTLTQEIVKVSDNSKSKVQLLLTTDLLCLIVGSFVKF